MRLPGQTDEKGILAWFAANHVAANLMMFVIIVAGIISAFTIRKETQPEFELNMISVQVPYLGAGPEEVEEGVVIKIEEAIQDIDGINKIRSTAREGSGNVTLEISLDADLNEVMQSHPKLVPYATKLAGERMAKLGIDVHGPYLNELLF